MSQAEHNARRTAWLASLQVGDIVTRDLGGVPMAGRIERMDDTLFYWRALNFPAGPEGWTFDRATGAEVDEFLKWGPQYGVTGSFLLTHERP